MQKLSGLARLASYLKPYWPQALMAGTALLVAAGSVLAIGQGLRLLIDEGFASRSPGTLDRMLLLTTGVVVILAAASALRFFFIMLK